MYAAVLDRVPTEDTKEKKNKEELIHHSIHPSPTRHHKISAQTAQNSSPTKHVLKQQLDDLSLDLSGMGREGSRCKATKTSL